jgi:uncharacterized membrane protein YjjP (DUF1212 family)
MRSLLKSHAQVVVPLSGPPVDVPVNLTLSLVVQSWMAVMAAVSGTGGVVTVMVVGAVVLVPALFLTVSVAE